MRGLDRTREQPAGELAEPRQPVTEFEVMGTERRRAEEKQTTLAARAIGAMGNGVIWVDMDEEKASRKGYL